MGVSGGGWGWGAESAQGQVHGPTESERARPPVPKPHTPPTAQAETDNGSLCPASRMQGAWPGTRWLHSSCASHRPSLGLCSPVPETPCPRTSLSPNPAPEPSQPRGAVGGGGIGSHHSAPPVALDGKIWAEEQVSNGQEEGLGQGTGILVIVFSLLRTQHPGPPQWQLAKERWPQDLGEGRRMGSGPRQSLGQNQRGLGAVGKPPADRRGQATHVP